MSEIKELVPPLDLCKLIPAGEFEDSAFIWDKTDTVGFWDGVDKDGNSIGGFGKIPARKWRVRQNFSERCRKRMKESGTVLNVYPAPTLQEIMEELPATTVCGKEHHSDWYVSHWRIGCVEDTERLGAASAALLLWLKMKGIEYGK